MNSQYEFHSNEIWDMPFF